MRFPVSGSTCKGLGSHHSMLTREKVTRLENQQLFLDPYERGGHQANLLPPRAEGQTERRIQKQRLPTAREGSPELQLMDCSKHNSDHSGATNSREPSHWGEVYSRS